jgi:hypothetical protein
MGKNQMNESSSVLQTTEILEREQFADVAITRNVTVHGADIGLKYLSQPVSSGNTGLQTAYRISSAEAEGATLLHDV